MSQSKARNAAAGRTPHSKDDKEANRYIKTENTMSFESMMARITAGEKTPWGWLMRNIFRPIWRPISRTPFNLRMWWQRRTRGYSDDELWSLDWSLVRWFLPRMRAFTKRKRPGYPSCLDGMTTKYSKRAEKKWQKILDKILWSFEYVYQMQESEGPIHKEVFTVKKRGKEAFGYNQKVAEKHWKRYKEGMDLFGEYLMNLWD